VKKPKVWRLGVVDFLSVELCCALESIRVDGNDASVSEDIVRLDTSSNIPHARICHGAGKIIYELWKPFHEVDSDVDNNTGHYFLESWWCIVSCTDLAKIALPQRKYLYLRVTIAGRLFGPCPFILSVRVKYKYLNFEVTLSEIYTFPVFQKTVITVTFVFSMPKDPKCPIELACLLQCFS